MIYKNALQQYFHVIKGKVNQGIKFLIFIFSDLGVHIDGFISQCAHTVVAGQTAENVLTGRPADVICAAYFALESALRMIRPGKTVSCGVNITIHDIALRAQD